MTRMGRTEFLCY